MRDGQKHIARRYLVTVLEQVRAVSAAPTPFPLNRQLSCAISPDCVFSFTDEQAKNGASPHVQDALGDIGVCVPCRPRTQSRRRLHTGDIHASMLCRRLQMPAPESRRLEESAVWMLIAKLVGQDPAASSADLP